MKAIKIKTPGHAEVEDVSTPQIRPGYVLVKTVAVALNPTDWKHIDFVPCEGSTSGCDFAGVVQELGPGVTDVAVGDRIAGFAHGGNANNKEDGAFAEYLVAKAGPHMKIPESVSWEEAATLGVGITTVGQGLYQSLRLPLPEQPAKTKFPVLIYGGSTATGALAIQFAKLSGLDVITTCSPRNFDLVHSLGASAAFDYNSPTCGADIRAHTQNSLYHAFDCVSEHSSPTICAEALSTETSSKKPAYSALLNVEFPRQDVDARQTLGYTVVGEEFFKFGANFPAKKEDFEFGKMFWALSQRLLEEKKFRVHQPDVRDGGLNGVLEGLNDLRQGKVSGKKLVYRIGSA
ncbi:chaperonin 10-like protein [Phyllosticta citribraziliensis]|uniref:Chaperonin 10-like protein n=1 Tax=Phyllosticta citribraziliensis TaxID=989973 RepID=A0ABR1LUJ3_9PEZI